MQDRTKTKMVAAGKVGIGVIRMASGGLTAVGLGVFGTFLRHHKMMQLANRIGHMSFEGGSKMFEEGCAEFRQP
jgi:hypothetical protein